MSDNIQQAESMRYGRERQIPTGLKLRVLFGGVTMFIGIAFLVMGSLFLFVFGSISGMSTQSVPEDAGEAKAVITKIESTNSSVNGQSVYNFHYEFKHHDGNTYQGFSYGEGMILQEGQEVDIEFDRQNPEISQIKGMRMDTMPGWVILPILPFVLIGAGFTGYNFIKNRKSLELLRIGQVTYGKLITKEPTNTRINNRTVYKLTFEFQVRNQTYHTVAKSHQPEKLMDEREEKLVYNPDDPNEAQMIDELTGAVKKYFEKSE